MDSSRTNTRDHIVEIVNRNLKNAVLETNPFDHWIYNKVLPIKIADDLLNLSINPPEISFYSGKRESNNNTRVFL